jgi:hypothetical protein
MKLINFLTNAKIGRHNPIIEALIDPSLALKKLDVEVEEIRDILGLNNSANDYALQAMLACINMYPEILHAVEEPNLIGQISSYKKPEPFIVGAKIVPMQNQFSIYFRPHKIYKNLDLEVSYVDNNNIKLKLDNDIWFVGYRYNVNLLTINFPEELSSLKFQVEPFMDWQPGAFFVLTLVANSYPFKEVIKNLSASDYFIKAANKFGLLDSFYSSVELPYKLALAGLVLYKSHAELV